MNSLVRDMMTTEVVTVELSTPFKEIVARLAERRVSAAPVLDSGGRAVGVVSEADLLLKEEHPDPDLDVPLVWSRRRRLERDKAAATVAGELMTAPAVTVPPTATVAEAARRMHAAGVKRLPVVDEEGLLVGIVSRADLLKVFTRPDHAIRREIMGRDHRRRVHDGPEPLLHPRRRRRGRPAGPLRAAQHDPVPAAGRARRGGGGPRRGPARL
jgi:CBS domain-containing protein